jgi:hypothetical protein
MTFEKILDQIESHTFSAEVNVAGGYSAFRSILASNGTVLELVSFLSNRSLAERCLRRIGSLASLTVDLRFENPFDAALAAYLHALSAKHPDLSRIGASVVQACPRCWWGRRVANHLLAPGQDTTRHTGLTVQSVPTTSGRVVELWRMAGLATPEVRVTYLTRPSRPGDLPIEEQVIAATASPRDIEHALIDASTSKPDAMSDTYVYSANGVSFVPLDPGRSGVPVQEMLASK